MEWNDLIDDEISLEIEDNVNYEYSWYSVFGVSDEVTRPEFDTRVSMELFMKSMIKLEHMVDSIFPEVSEIYYYTESTYAGKREIKLCTLDSINWTDRSLNGILMFFHFSGKISYKHLKSLFNIIYNPEKNNLMEISPGNTFLYKYTEPDFHPYQKSPYEYTSEGLVSIAPYTYFQYKQTDDDFLNISPLIASFICDEQSFNKVYGPKIKREYNEQFTCKEHRMKMNIDDILLASLSIRSLQRTNPFSIEFSICKDYRGDVYCSENSGVKRLYREYRNGVPANFKYGSPARNKLVSYIKEEADYYIKTYSDEQNLICFELERKDVKYITINEVDEIQKICVLYKISQFNTEDELKVQIEQIHKETGVEIQTIVDELLPINRRLSYKLKNIFKNTKK